MPDDLKPIREWTDVSREKFRAEILPLQQPAVLRGLVGDWPLVERGRQSPNSFVDYLTGFWSGELVRTVIGAPEIGGRLFYTDDMSALNFQTSQEKMPNVLRGLIKQIGSEAPPAIALQAIAAPDQLPGVEAENPMPLLDEDVAPKFWIGNRVTVAPHFDMFENIACVAAGRRRFTLFPPEQLPNLYIGPIDFTPAGAPISMVAVDDPDFDRFPRFREALEAAQSAELEPGDAIFIPYMWWHGVQSLTDFNVLVNYWWSEQPPAVHPYGPLLHASLVYRDMPQHQKMIWRSMFDLYVFNVTGEPMSHLDPRHRATFGKLDEARIRKIKAGLAKELLEEPKSSQPPGAPR